MNVIDATLPRFAGVGVATTAVHVATAFLANATFPIAPVVANAIGFATAASANYLGNYYWTFQSRSRHAMSLGRFALLAAWSFISTTAIVYGVCTVLAAPFMFALALIGVTIPPINYLLARFWVFRPSGRHFRWTDIDLPLALIGVVLAAWFYTGTMLNHDTSWLLIATRRWLDGAILYRDIMEINPPLIFFLSAPAVWLATHTALSAKTAVIFFTSGLVVVSVTWSWRLWHRSIKPHLRFVMLAAAFTGLLVTVVPAFGQREHLMIILALPYLVLAAFKPKIIALERCAIGLFALPGLALKPYFLMVPLSVAILQVWRDRRLSAALTVEHIAIGFGCILYLSAIALFYPRYIDVIVPVGQLVYSAYHGSPLHVLAAPALFAFLLLVWLFRQSVFTTDRDRDVAITLLSVTGALVCIYLWQFKGWFYHRLPIHAVLCISTAWILSTSTRRAAHDRLARTLLVGAVVYLTLVPVLRGPYYNPTTSAFRTYLGSKPRESRFIALSAHVWASFPLANKSGAHVTSRYPALWLIPGAIVQRTKSEDLSRQKRRALAHVLDFARTSTVDDFLAGQPTLVFVEVRPQKTYFRNAAFNYLSFFKKDPRFASGWTHYRQIGKVYGFEVWKRTRQ